MADVSQPAVEAVSQMIPRVTTSLAIDTRHLVPEVNFDPFLITVFIVAMVMCAGGVMATLYVIRKTRKLRRFYRRQPLLPAPTIVPTLYPDEGRKPAMV